MKTYDGAIVLAAAVAAVAFVAGPDALAGPGKQKRIATTGSMPTQPIAYSQLDAYTKASPSQRKAKDWSQPNASIGASTDTSATTGDTASTTAGGDSSRTPSTSEKSPNTVNPRSDTTPPVNPDVSEGTPPTGIGSMESMGRGAVTDAQPPK